MSDTSDSGAGRYEPPQLKDHGALNDITQGGTTSGYLDANYQQGTPSNYGGGLFSPGS